MSTADPSPDRWRGATPRCTPPRSRDPEGFWLEAAGRSTGRPSRRRAFDAGSGVYGRWFPDGDAERLPQRRRPARRRRPRRAGRDPATIRRSPATKRDITYARPAREVSALAAVLARPRRRPGRPGRHLHADGARGPVRHAGLRPASARSIRWCSAGSPPTSSRVRIEDAAPKVVLAASCGIEPTRIVAYKPLLDAAIAGSRTSPPPASSCSGPQAVASLVDGRDRDWAEAVAAAKAAGREADCVPMAATDPLYILYTSGTTASPRASCAIPAATCVALSWSMPNLYGVQPGEVYFCASDIGWVVGHSYIVYAPLLHGCTTVLYEGKPVGTPDAGAFWRVIAEYGIACLFTAPTALRAMKKEDPRAELVERLRSLGLSHPVPRRRARRPGFRRLGRAGARSPGDRPLVADRDRVGHRRQPGGDRPTAGQARQHLHADAGLRPPRPRRGRQAGPRRHDGHDRPQAAPAARLPADPVGLRRTLPSELPHHLPRLLRHLGCRRGRRGRLRHRARAHRRHHQRRRSSALDRRAWRRCWRPTRMSPNAPSSASATR